MVERHCAGTCAADELLKHGVKKKDAMGMTVMKYVWLRMRRWGSWFPILFAKSAKSVGHPTVVRSLAAGLLAMGLAGAALTGAQSVNTTTVQGTVYLANGQPGAGTLAISWPAFTTAAGQAVAADSTTVTIAPDGFVSVNLAPNVGATPAGEYYTAVYYMSDGSTSTQYWVVPAAASASLAQVQAQVMPAAQAVQTVSKAYVDQAITELTQSLLTASGGTLSGPLYLNADPTQPLQAADKHYVDVQVATAVPIAGGNMTGALSTPAVNGVEAPSEVSGQTSLQSAMIAAGTNGAMEIPPTYAGTDTFTNPNGVRVTDLRTGVAQQTARSVKEFGAVCDGVTDDTNALQAAINYANAHGVALTIPEGTCKTRTLSWHGESIGGLGKQVSALMGFPGEDVLASGPDATNMLSYTRLHDLTIYVDQSVDASCAPAEGRAAAGSCQMSRAMEGNSIFSPGGNGLTGTAGTGAGWWVGNCAIAMQAATGAGGNGLKVAEIENVEIAPTGVDPMAAQYPGAHSTHTCGMYLAQWPQWSEFQNIDVRGLNTGVAIPALPVTAPAGLTADSNRWQNVTIQATHAFTAAAGSNNVLDNVVAMAGNSSATGEPPTGLVMDLNGTAQGWTVRNAVVMPAWIAVQPALTVTAAGGAVTAVTLGTEQGLGWDAYGASVPVAFSGSCTAQATATVNVSGSIASVTVTQGGVGCSSTTTASVNAPGTWDTAAPVNLIGGQDMTFFAGNLLKGNGGYTVWNAASSASYGTQLDGGGGTLPGGGTYAALVANNKLGGAYQVDQFPGADIGAKIQACVNAVNTSYGGTCDARNFTGSLSMASNLTISTGNTAVLLPCATITTANQIVVAAGTRNVSLRGCALRGGTQASGSQGGTVFAYTGAGAMVHVGDPTYATDTPGFHMDNVAINTTGAASGAQGLIAYRTQELDLGSLYFLGNQNQTGMTLDGTGNYTGGTFLDNQLTGFGTAVNAIGHQIANSATTDWMNASTFVRLHIDCPTSGGSPISGTYGINLQQGDGNTFTGGDVEGCATALHLGPNAQNNTIVGLRNENSTSQVVADAGSAYNNWMTGGTMFTGQLTDNGTRNSFLDTFHRSFNGLNGDWYASQQDATVTNHYRLGIGTGNERGIENEYQTDYGNRWTTGLSDATAGEQFYQILDQLNNVYRLSIGQYNNGQSSTNDQTVLNSAGTGAVVLNGSNNSGTGGVSFGSGGASATTVATINNAGNAQFAGTLQVGGTSQSTGTMTVRNNTDAEVDYNLWPGLTTSQKGSYTYKDWNGNSQWYMVKDASNNWALNSATGGLDSFKAYQSTNGGDTYIDISNSTGHIRLNYENGSGTETDIYSGPSASLDAAFQGPASIQFPGLAASSGHFCLQVDTSGYLTNTGAACGSGSGGASGTISSGNSGQIAYYTASGTTIGGISTVPLTDGGTGATTAAAALTNLGGLPLAGGTLTGALTAPAFNGPVTGNSLPLTSPYADIRAYGAVIDRATPINTAVTAAQNNCTAFPSSSGAGVACKILIPGGGPGALLGPTSTPLTQSSGGVTGVKLQGTLQLSSTLVLGGGVIEGDCGGTDDSFEYEGCTALIRGPQVGGTFGTAITTTNAAQSVTPTFTSGALANLPVGSAITIWDNTSCTGSVTRAIGPQSNGNANFYTIQCPARTDIGPQEYVTVTGCTDATYDTLSNGAAIDGVDWPLFQLSWYGPTGTAGSTTGCTITGRNWDTIESVEITGSNGTSCAAGQLCFVNTYAHPAGAQWGEVAIRQPWNEYGHTELKGVHVESWNGAAFWGEGSTGMDFEGDAFDGFGSVAMEFSSAQYQGSYMKNVVSASTPNWGSGCGETGTNNCSQISFPPSLFCDSLPSNSPSGATSGGCPQLIVNSTLYGGIFTRGNPDSPQSIAIPSMTNVVVERSNGCFLTVDPRYGLLEAPAYIDNSGVSDPADSGSGVFGGGTAYLCSTDPASFAEEIHLRSPYSFDTYNLAAVNKYWQIPYETDNADESTMTWGRNAPQGATTDGTAIDAEIRNEGASLGPSVIPYTTLPVDQTVAAWTTDCRASCTVTAVRAPDGTTNAGEIQGTGYASVEWYNVTAAIGDRILYGAWVRPGTGEKRLQAAPGANAALYLRTSGAISLNRNDAGAYGMWLGNDKWHPQVALATVTTGGVGGVQLDLYGGGSGQGNQFWNPCMIYIPASANISNDEIERWRQDLLHGTCPSNYTGGTGHAVTTQQIDAAGFNILNTATGAVTPLGFGNLSGTASIAQGGTGATSAAGALTNLGAAPLSGAAFTGLVSAPAGVFKDSVTNDWKHVYSGFSVPPATAATLKINLPSSVRFNSTFATLRITIYNGDPLGANQGTVGELLVSFYNFSGDTYAFPTLSSYGAFPFSSVRLADDGTYNCILLGTTATNWGTGGAIQFSIDVLTGDNLAPGWNTGWSSSYITSETGITTLDTFTVHGPAVTDGTGTSTSGLIAESTTTPELLQYVAPTGSGAPVNAISPTLTTPVLGVASATSVTASGVVSGTFFTGSGTMTLATGAAAGTSPSIACATSHVCDSVSGTVTLTTGTSPTTGTLATLTFPSTHTNYANCMVSTLSASAVLTSNTWTESTTAITIKANAGLTASTAYTVKYWCGGN